ncbi:unnamed protein product [Auanema sp. JU1783]|nr:unnamed protein product [Auanema sp. JU1783]
MPRAKADARKKVVKVIPLENDTKENEFEAFPNQIGELRMDAADNYFLQGKMIQLNKGRRRKGKDELSDDEDSSEESPFTSCDLEKLGKYAETSGKFIPKSVNKKLDELREDFSAWRLYLANGFNILMHGVGSKRNFLKEFIAEFQDQNVCEIDGLCDEGSTREVLNRIEKSFHLSIAAPKKRNLISFATQISQKLTRGLTIFIHNIDGPLYRDTVDQEAFKILSQNPDIRLVATIDHMNACSLWNSRQITEFNWVFINVNTFEVPISELIAGQSKLLGFDSKSSQYTHTISSLDVFWESLNKNAKEIFRVFFCMTYASKHAVAFFDLSEEARSKFLVSSDAALRQILVELKDHKIIIMRRKDDGNELLESIVDKNLVEKFFSEKGLDFEL